MCNAMTAGRRFEPGLCPLLAGLPPDEQEERMRDDPRIRACIAAIEGGGASSPAVSKMINAYEHCVSDACTVARSGAPESLVDAG